MRTLLSRLLGLAMLAGSLAGGWIWLDYRNAVDAPLALGGEPLRIEVPRGASLRQVAADLERRGVLAHPRYLRWHARARGLEGAIKAGEYDLAPGLTLSGLLDLLVSGAVVQHALTLVEGWTFAEARAAVAAHPALRQTLGEAGDEEVMRRLGHPGVHPEGRFLPDTYHFPRGTTDVEFLRRAYDAMARTLAEEWDRREPGLPLASPDEALILASIVEKETGVAEERPRIAGVFVRRLRRGMRLQTDPTVIYGLGSAFDGDLRRADLRRDTPYNTYTRRGLPPTPIALPGRASIRAVLHPSEEDALYFVARGDGRHHFSATYAEHRRAVVRYQLAGRRRGSARPADAP